MRRAAHLVASLAALTVVSHAARAQSVSASGATTAVIQSGTRITMPGVFGATPETVVQDPDSTGACSSGACFDAPVTVHANTKWQLQVTLDSPSPDYVVVWVESRSPSITHPLTAGVYQTVASGSAATSAQIVPLLFNANKTTGKGGFVPTAAQLAAVLSYRVIAAP